MKEIVILSGKGGTGKTSIAAAFAALAGQAVLTDCDVDASNLHLILSPSILETHSFFGGIKARIVEEECRQCGICMERCRFDAISRKRMPNGRLSSFQVDPLACEGCGVCLRFCPHGAIVEEKTESGKWFRSDTRFGPFLHARLGVAAENSGKLVTLLRNEAREVGAKESIDLLLTDGPPGIGCPVIASLTTADHAVFVTEPTVSGLHDLKRVVELAKGFKIPGSVIINRADVNRDKAEEINVYARENEIFELGVIPYDPVFSKAQIARRSIVEYDDGPASTTVKEIWMRLQKHIGV
jgi:MinD superfamily P-loop ATPase